LGNGERNLRSKGPRGPSERARASQRVQWPDEASVATISKTIPVLVGDAGLVLTSAMPDGVKLAEFTAWCGKNITGDEKGQAHIFLDRLFQACIQPKKYNAS